MYARVILGLVLLVAFSIFSATRFCLQVASYERGAREHRLIASFEERYHELLRVLPARGVVGYVDDDGPSATSAAGNFRTTSAAGNFRCTQYVLAPLTIAHETNHPFVIGNFRLEAAYRAKPPSLEHRLVVDFGNGVLLFRREGD